MIINRIPLEEEISQFINGTPSGSDSFFDIALKVFQFQYLNNDMYRKYCDSLDKKPSKIKTLLDIPAIPTEAFKYGAVTTFPENIAEKVFHTSGTTTGDPGKHYMLTTYLYKQAALRQFERFVVPDLRSRKFCTIAFAPSPLSAPNSSLSFMFDLVSKGLNLPIFYCDLTLPIAVKEIEDLTRTKPVLLLGTAFAFVHFYDKCMKEKKKFKFAPASRVMETGGFKGKSREVTKPQLYKMIREVTGIVQGMIINEYGMTELSSQFYDVSIDRQTNFDTDFKEIPHWVKVIMIDPATGDQCGVDRPGLIRIYDLANLYSCFAIQTADLGLVEAGHPTWFKVLGRLPGAMPRGCSIGFDESLQAR